jgi:hypothetical protein
MHLESILSDTQFRGRLFVEKSGYGILEYVLLARRKRSPAPPQRGTFDPLTVLSAILSKGSLDSGQ